MESICYIANGLQINIPAEVATSVERLELGVALTMELGVALTMELGVAFISKVVVGLWLEL